MEAEMLCNWGILPGESLYFVEFLRGKGGEPLMEKKKFFFKSRVLRTESFVEGTSFTMGKNWKSVGRSDTQRFLFDALQLCIPFDHTGH